jgi:hypothetical protein
VGIGSTPDAWKSTWTALDIGVSGSLYAQDNNTTGLANNLFFTGSAWAHKNTGATTLYQQSEGAHYFYSNASQSAGATFSPTERMRIDSSGRVGVFNSNPTNYTGAGARSLVVGSNSSATTPHGITIVGGSSSTSNLAFTDNAGDGSANDYRGLFQYHHPDDSLRVFVASTERMRIDSSGRVTTPSQPAFFANAVGTFANGAVAVNQKITYNVNSLDVGSNFSTSTGRFTAPVAGNYFISVCTGFYSSSVSARYVRTSLFKNGGSPYPLEGHNHVSDETNNADYHQVVMSGVVPLSANDYLEVWWATSASANQVALAAFNTNVAFSGYLIG